MKIRYVQRLEPRAEMFARVGRYVYCFGGGGSGFSAILEQILSQYVSFAYMGSSEYEFGAAAKSLRHFHEDKDEYSLFPVTIKRQIDKKKCQKDIILLCKPDQNDDIVKALKTLKEWDTKQASMWVYTLKGEHDKTTGWWDIENHFMWFIDENQAKFFLDLIKDTDKYVKEAEERFKEAPEVAESAS